TRHDHVVSARVDDAGASEIAEHLVGVGDAISVGIVQPRVRAVQRHVRAARRTRRERGAVYGVDTGGAAEDVAIVVRSTGLRAGLERWARLAQQTTTTEERLGAARIASALHDTHVLLFLVGQAVAVGIAERRIREHVAYQLPDHADVPAQTNLGEVAEAVSVR